MTGKPEWRTIHWPYTRRIRTGDAALQFFTFWRCHYAGVFQRVEVDPDADFLYYAEVYGVSMYTNCSSKPYQPPWERDLDGDGYCDYPLPDSHAWQRIGIRLVACERPQVGLGVTALTSIALFVTGWVSPSRHRRRCRR